MKTKGKYICIYIFQVAMFLKRGVYIYIYIYIYMCTKNATENTNKHRGRKTGKSVMFHLSYLNIVVPRIDLDR